jgi:hypothetical protein
MEIFIRNFGIYLQIHTASLSDRDVNILYNFLFLLQFNELFISTWEQSDMGAFPAADLPFFNLCRLTELFAD